MQSRTGPSTLKPTRTTSAGTYHPKGEGVSYFILMRCCSEHGHDENDDHSERGPGDEGDEDEDGDENEDEEYPEPQQTAQDETSRDSMGDMDSEHGDQQREFQNGHNAQPEQINGHAAHPETNLAQPEMTLESTEILAPPTPPQENTQAPIEGDSMDVTM